MEQQADKGVSPQLNSDTGLLKTAAMLTMLIDHVGVMFFPGVVEMRVIGRIAFPLFCWGIVTGSVHTRSVPKYALRLLLVGLIAQPFYMLALRHTIHEWNVMATLLLGLAAIIGIQKKFWFSHLWAPLLCLCLAAMQQMDYGWRGVLLIILMYLARQSRGGLSALMISFCLFWGSSSSEVTQMFGFTIKPQLDFYSPFYPVVAMFFSMVRLQALAVLSLPFMVFRTHTGIRVPKWLSYAMYPGHLIILWLFKLVLG